MRILVLVTCCWLVSAGLILGQCLPGYSTHTITGQVAAIYQSNAVINPDFILGNPDNQGAEFYENGDYISVDLGYTLLSGGQYTISWKQRVGATGTSTMRLFESVDGSIWTQHPQSIAGTITTINETSYDLVIINANIDSRYIRILKNTLPDFLIDAVTYVSNVRQPDPNCAIGSVENQISGNATSVTSETGITNSAYILGSPNGLGAQLMMQETLLQSG